MLYFRFGKSLWLQAKLVNIHQPGGKRAVEINILDLMIFLKHSFRFNGITLCQQVDLYFLLFLILESLRVTLLIR